MQRSPGGIGLKVQGLRERPCPAQTAGGRTWHGVADGMADKSPGRTRGDRIRSDSALLTPLPAAGQPEASTAADIRAPVETVGEPEAPVARPPRPDDCGAEALQQAAQDVSTAIEALRTDHVQAEERRAGTIPEIRETRTAIPKGTGVLAETANAGEAIRGALEASAGELRDSREAAERLTRSSDSGATGAARPVGRRQCGSSGVRRETTISRASATATTRL